MIRWAFSRKWKWMTHKIVTVPIPEAGREIRYCTWSEGVSGSSEDKWMLDMMADGSRRTRRTSLRITWGPENGVNRIIDRICKRSFAFCGNRTSLYRECSFHWAWHNLLHFERWVFLYLSCLSLHYNFAAKDWLTVNISLGVLYMQGSGRSASLHIG